MLVECTIEKNGPFGVAIEDDAFHKIVGCTITQIGSQSGGPAVLVSRRGHVHIENCLIEGSAKRLSMNPAMHLSGAPPVMRGSSLSGHVHTS